MMDREDLFKKILDMVSDPDIKDNPLYKEIHKSAENTEKLVADIADSISDYVGRNSDGNEWPHVVLIALARATCRAINALEHCEFAEGKDIFRMFHGTLLPLTWRFTRLERAMTEERLRQGTEGPAPLATMKEDLASFERKKELIEAIADPEISVDEILDRFYKKDMSRQEREYHARALTQYRRLRAAQLKEFNENRKKAN